MRFILRYRYGFFQKKSQRINVISCLSTDDLVTFVEKKTNKKEGEFILRCKNDSRCYRIIRGWSLSDYEIAEGDQLELEMLERDQSETQKLYSNKYLTNVLGTQRHELNKIVEQENQQDEGNQQNKSFNVRSYLDKELERILKAVQKGKLQPLLKIIEELPETIDEQTTIELQRLKPRLLNDLGDGGWGAIHYAVFCNKLDILDQLISRSVDINKCTADGWLPLQLAVNRKHKEALQSLLKKQQIRINEVTQKGTALHIAAKCGYLEGIGMLIEAGANWRITDQKGKNSLEVCVDNDCTNLIVKKQQLQAKQEQSKVNFQTLAILQGCLFKSKTVFMHLSERYLVLDPYQGSLVFYSKQQDYPKHPKQTIPIEEIKLQSIELLVGDKRSWQMKKDYSYLSLMCPKQIILAYRHLQIAVKWVSGFQSAVKYNKFIAVNRITEIVPQQDQVIIIVDDRTNKITSNKEVLTTVVPPTCHRRQTKISDVFKRSNISSEMSSDCHSPQMPNKLTSLSISSRPSQKAVGDDETTMGSKKNSNDDTEHEMCLKVQENNKVHGLNPESRELTNELTQITSHKVNFSSFEIIKVLGSGNFGKVFLAKNISNGKEYALKALKKKTLIMKKQIKYAISEAKILKQANHTFIINLHYAFQTPNYLYLALDYCPGRDLSLHLAREGTFGQDESRIYIAELILAMEHLHSKNILYRDLKPENILLDAQGHIKLADFGLSKDNIDSKMKSICGTPAYIAPEVLNHKGGCKESDIYGIGVVLYEFLVGQSAYFSDNIDTLYNNINCAELKFPKYVSEPAKNIVRGLMDRDPKKRLGAKGYDQIKKHPFFKTIDWKLAETRGLKPPVRQFNGEDSQSDDEIAIFTNQKRFVDYDYEQNAPKPNKLNHFSFVRNYDE